MTLTLLQQNIINGYQKGLPLCAQPYQTMAQELGCSECEVLDAIKSLSQQKILSRIGAVFDHKKAGASTLAAIAVPDEKLDKVAEQVNQFDQVNHNYAREHHYNLWFVVTSADQTALKQTLLDIENITGFEVLVLPMETSYHIDLGFKIEFEQQSRLSVDFVKEVSA